jgi:hypothetical protein
LCSDNRTRLEAKELEVVDVRSVVVRSAIDCVGKRGTTQSRCGRKEKREIEGESSEGELMMATGLVVRKRKGVAHLR